MKRKHFGEDPRWWKTDGGGYTCNVSNIHWIVTKQKWVIRRVDENGLEKAVGTTSFFDEAVKMRRECPPDSKCKAGELKFLDSGRIVMTSCSRSTCKRVDIPVAEFAPDPCMFKDEFKRFVDALVLARSTRDLKSLTPLVRKQCYVCRCCNKQSRLCGANSVSADCRRMAEVLRCEAKAVGCKVCGCTEALQIHHAGRANKEECVFDWRYWSAKYGSEGAAMMAQEYRKENAEILCAFHHFLDETHNAFQGCAAEDATSDYSRYMIVERDKKKSYNNNMKCEVGECYDCKRLCEKGLENAFHWAHISEIGKTKSVGQIVGSSLTAATACEMMRQVVDGEDGGWGCRLKCANCHYENDTLPAMREGADEWSALILRGY